jgi:hypothetical protein
MFCFAMMTQVVFPTHSILFLAIFTVAPFRSVFSAWGTRWSNLSHHGKTKQDDKPMDGPNPDHASSSAQSPYNRPTDAPNQENKQKMNYGNDGREQKGRNGKGSRDNMAN